MRFSRPRTRSTRIGGPLLAVRCHGLRLALVLCYTAMLIALVKGWRIVVAQRALLLLAVTAVMTFFAGMWFRGSYL